MPGETPEVLGSSRSGSIFDEVSETNRREQQPFEQGVEIVTWFLNSCSLGKTRKMT
jgi:hypothetical protein